VLFAATAASIAFAWRMQRRGNPAALVRGGALGLFGGLATLGLALGHLTAVALVELRRSPRQYDFRVYSLLLLGGTLAALGAGLAASAAGVARGERAAWNRAVGIALALLVVNGPLAPIQGFAVAVLVFVLVGLGGLLAARPHDVEA
jgi:hypothetical protein